MTPDSLSEKEIVATVWIVAMVLLLLRGIVRAYWD
jgi:hypothetical protein